MRLVKRYYVVDPEVIESDLVVPMARALLQDDLEVVIGSDTIIATSFPCRFLPRCPQSNHVRLLPKETGFELESNDLALTILTFQAD